MKILTKFVAMKIYLLVLLAPLIIRYFSNIDASDSISSDLPFGVSMSLIYVGVAIAGRPIGVFEGARKFNVDKLTLRLIFVSAAMVVAATAINYFSYVVAVATATLGFTIFAITAIMAFVKK